MIDNTYGFRRISLADGFSGYNQIKMYPEDEKHTSFRTHVGVYCYIVMPFGLKNAGAIYQRSMNMIFHEHICKTVKSHNKGDHLTDLKRMFDIMRAHPLKMNPTKSFLGVASGKLFGFIVTSKEIHLDSEKICAVQKDATSEKP